MPGVGLDECFEAFKGFGVAALRVEEFRLADQVSFRPSLSRGEEDRDFFGGCLIDQIGGVEVAEEIDVDGDEG